jgi:hypothetical protein
MISANTKPAAWLMNNNQAAGSFFIDLKNKEDWMRAVVDFRERPSGIIDLIDSRISLFLAVGYCF